MPHHIAGALSIALGLFITPLTAAAPQILLSPETHVVTGNAPQAMVAADFNEDGRLDLAVSVLSTIGVVVLIGQPDDSFTALPPIAIGSRAVGIAAADFDGDGHLDLVATDGPVERVALALGRGDGTFQAAASYDAGISSVNAIAADVNGDHLPDVILGGARFGKSILLNFGGGVLGPRFILAPNINSLTGTTTLASADLDGDGFDDMAETGYWNGGPEGECIPQGVTFWRGFGTGSFQGIGIPGFVCPRDLALADLNADGRKDILELGAGVLNRHLNLGGGSFTGATASPLAVPGASVKVLVADFNGDGVPDVALGQSAASLVLMTGEANGALGAGQVVPLADSFNRMIAADFNGDGDLDLAVNEVSLGRIGIFLNRRSTPNRPPVAAAGADRQANCTSQTGGSVTLDGSASSDPDSDPGTNEDIVTFEWFENFGAAGQTLLGTAETLTGVSLAMGTHALTLRVTDRAGLSDTDDVAITVADGVPPTLSAGAAPSVLSPVHHQLVPVHVTVSTADACGPATFVLLSVSSSEPDDLPGSNDCSTTGDIQDAAVGTPDVDLLLRAERNSQGPGRVYTLTYQVTDSAGLTRTGVSQVTVPKNKPSALAPPTAREVPIGVMPVPPIP